MLTSRGAGYLPDDVISYSTAFRARCRRVNDLWHPNNETGSCMLPLVCRTGSDETRVLANSHRLYNSFLSALAAADALGRTGSTSPKTFPFPVAEAPPGTISGYGPVSRSSIAPAHQHNSNIVEQHLASHFGTTDLSVFTALHEMQTRSSHENSVCPSISPSVCQTRGLREKNGKKICPDLYTIRKII